MNPHFLCLRNARAFPLLPAALASVPFGLVLVRVRLRKEHRNWNERRLVVKNLLTVVMHRQFHSHAIHLNTLRKRDEMNLVDISVDRRYCAHHLKRCKPQVHHYQRYLSPRSGKNKPTCVENYMDYFIFHILIIFTFTVGIDLIVIAAVRTSLLRRCLRGLRR
jgi:hypothetical protein